MSTGGEDGLPMPVFWCQNALMVQIMTLDKEVHELTNQNAGLNKKDQELTDENATWWDLMVGHFLKVQELTDENATLTVENAALKQTIIKQNVWIARMAEKVHPSKDA